MKLWHLALCALRQLLRGRGRHQVLLRLDGLSDTAQAEQDVADWELYDWHFPDTCEPFMVLCGRPASDADAEQSRTAYDVTLSRAVFALSAADLAEVRGQLADALGEADKLRAQLAQAESHAPRDATAEQLTTELDAVRGELHAERRARELWFADPDPAGGDGVTLDYWRRKCSYWFRLYHWELEANRALDDRLARTEGRPVAVQYRVQPPIATPPGGYRVGGVAAGDRAGTLS